MKDPRGATRGPGTLAARPRVGPRQGGAWTPWSTPGPLRPIFTPRSENLRGRTLFPDPFSVLRPSSFQDRGCQETLSRHPAGGRIHLRELLYRNGRFPDDSCVVNLGPWVYDQ